MHDIKRHALWYFECEVEEVKMHNNNLETKITNFLYRFQPNCMMEAYHQIITIDDDFIKINFYIRLEKDKSVLQNKKKKNINLNFRNIKKTRRSSFQKT